MNSEEMNALMVEMINSFRELSAMLEELLKEGDIVAVQRGFMAVFMTLCALRQEYENSRGSGVNVIKEFLQEYMAYQASEIPSENTKWN